MTPRLQFLFLVLATLLCSACLRGRLPSTPARAADPGARLVSSIWYSPLAWQWQHSPWFRPEYDLVTPPRVVIASDGFGCLMGNEVIEPQQYEYYVCPAGWRYPRTR